MITIYGVYENHIDDTGLIACFYLENEANKCAEYLNNLKRGYEHYYVEEISLYHSQYQYLIDVKSS